MAVGMLNTDFIGEIVNRIRTIREKAKLTREELSQILNKADNYISHIESRQTVISLPMLEKFLKIFYVPPALFFSDSFYEYLGEQKSIDRLLKIVAKHLPNIEDKKEKRKQQQKEYKEKLKEKYAEERRRKNSYN